MTRVVLLPLLLLLLTVTPLFAKNDKEKAKDTVSELTSDSTAEEREKGRAPKLRNIELPKVTRDTKDDKFRRSVQVYEKLRSEKPSGSTEVNVESTKERSTAGLAVMLKHMERLREKVSNSTIDTELKSKLLADLDADIAALKQKQTDVTAIADADTLKEFNRVAKEDWLKNKRIHNLTMARMRFESYRVLLEKTENLMTRLATMLSEQRGDDISTEATEAESKLVEAQAKLDLAKGDYQAALNILVSGLENEDTDFEEVHALLKSSKASLIDAKKLLRETFVLVKNEN